MLKHLVIKNYALIQHLEMEPSQMLNIITGETGAGKSIMIGAVGLLLGKRADIKVLYDEEKKCVIEGVFDLSSYELKDFFTDNDLDYQQQSIIRREINPSGKSRAFVNDTPVTLDVLKALGSYLMDVHSQHDTLLLASNEYQLSILDAYAQNQEILLQYRQTYKKYKKAEKEYSQLKKEAAGLKKEYDYNQFLFEELEKAQLKSGEQEDLEEELNLLENAEEVKVSLNESLQNLNHADFSVYSNLSTSVNLLNQIAGYAEKYRNLKERTESCLIEIKDIISELEKEESLVEFDPEKIAYTNERLNNIYNLQQKHQVSSIDELLKIHEELADKLNKVLDDELEEKKNEVERIFEGLEQKAFKLSESRKKIFKKFTKEIEGLLKMLGMPEASLEVDQKIIEPAENGIDQVKLLFSANKGVKVQELKNVASGGEFSRLMFTVKFVLAGKTALPTIVFDEVDTGISGEIAFKMVRMMEEMANNHQVLVITHLPQIAAKGDTHYFVYKDNNALKAVSKIRRLNNEERVQEIAKMLSGENPSAVALENARELLNQ